MDTSQVRRRAKREMKNTKTTTMENGLRYKRVPSRQGLKATPAMHQKIGRLRDGSPAYCFDVI